MVMDTGLKALAQKLGEDYKHSVKPYSPAVTAAGALPTDALAGHYVHAPEDGDYTHNAVTYALKKDQALLKTATAWRRAPELDKNLVWGSGTEQEKVDSVGYTAWIDTSAIGIESLSFYVNGEWQVLQGQGELSEEKFNSKLTIINRKTLYRADKDLNLESGSDIRFALRNAADTISGSGGGEIVFPSGYDCLWSNTLNLASDVHIRADGDVAVNMTGNAVSRAIRTVQDSVNNSITGDFVFNARGRITNTFIEAHTSGANEFLVDGPLFINTDDSDVQIALTSQGPVAITTGAGRGFSIRNISSDGIGTLVDLMKDSERVRLFNLNTVNPSNQSSILYVGHGVSDYIADTLEMGMYPANVVGGHMISFAGESVSNPTPDIYDGVLRGIKHHGREGIAYQLGLANGATGDIIAARSYNRLHIYDYELVGGGEFGIDLVHGGIQGTIGQGEIRNIDGAAIVVGGGAQIPDGNGGFNYVSPNIDSVVSGARIYNVGIDNAGKADSNDALAFSSICGIRFLNVERAKCEGCTIDGTTGAAIFITNSSNYPSTDIDIGPNSYRDIGTQNVGMNPVWSGGNEVSPNWDGTTLTPGTGNTTQPVTGVIEGIPFPAGAGSHSATRVGRLVQHVTDAGWTRKGRLRFSDTLHSVETTGITFSRVTSNGQREQKTIPAGLIGFTPISAFDGSDISAGLTEASPQLDSGFYVDSSDGSLKGMTANSEIAWFLFFRPSTSTVVAVLTTDPETSVTDIENRLLKEYEISEAQVDADDVFIATVIVSFGPAHYAASAGPRITMSDSLGEYIG